MSIAPPPPVAAAKPAAVIRRPAATYESANARLLKKHLPAWVVSGAVHVALIATLITADKLIAKPAPKPPAEDQLTVVADDKPEEAAKEDLTNDTMGFDPDLPAAVEAMKLDEVNVQIQVNNATDPVGLPDANTAPKQDVIPPPGVGPTDALTPGTAGEFGNTAMGAGAGGDGVMANAGFNGRNSGTRNMLVKAGGGNQASELAVARGLAWLAGQQKKNGSWVYDGGAAQHVAASTGMALLPFLAAGQSHKPTKDAQNKYHEHVAKGVDFLVKLQAQNKGEYFSTNMYAHAIATIALCELYGMTGDKQRLLAPTQKAVNYILNAQGSDGSWGYSAKTNGDTSIVGWQIQALHSAKLCKDLVVDKRAIEKARGFLNRVGAGPNKSTYGYSTPGASKTLTPVGLLCRYYADGWGPTHPGMAGGVGFLMKEQMPAETAKFDMYYYYYATQVLHFFDGPEWHKEWNPKMRDLLVNRQVPLDKGPTGGSWNADAGSIGNNCGRLGTTCLALLTLEVYYRHLPLYKRDTAGLKELERAR